MNADVLTNLNIKDFYIKHISTNAEITIATTEYSTSVPYAIFEKKGGKIISLKEKPTYRFESNAGCYIIKSEELKKFQKNTMI